MVSQLSLYDWKTESNLREVAGLGLRPGVIGCFQLKLKKQEEQAKQPVSLPEEEEDFA